MIEEKVIIRGNSSSKGKGSIKIEEFSLMQRIIKTFFKTLLALIITALSILIPILHFLLVPLGLLITVLVFYDSISRTKVIQEGSGMCPDCKGSIKIYGRPYKLPFTDICENCNRQIIIEEAL